MALEAHIIKFEIVWWFSSCEKKKTLLLNSIKSHFPTSTFKANYSDKHNQSFQPIIFGPTLS